jgi:DNA polymerase III alpha subunit
MPVQQLFDEAKRCGVHKLVLTEINNTGSYIEMLRICQNNRPQDKGLTRYAAAAYALDVVVGVEFRHNNELRYVAIARNNRGFESINRFLSFHNRENKPILPRAPEFEDVFIIYPYPIIEPEQLRK